MRAAESIDPDCSPPRPLVVIFNRRALAARALRRSGLEEALRERDIEHEVVATVSADESRQAAGAAARKGCAVVAAGGDGTTNHVLNGVLASAAPDPVMGVIPLGTGNDLARALGRVGRGLEQALDALAQFEVRSIDVAQAHDEYFLNVLGIGFDAEVVRRRGKRLVRLPGYLLDVTLTIASYRPQPYRVSWPGGDREGIALMTAAMNGTCEGGGFRLAPDASLVDGVLDVYWVEPVSFAQFLRYVWAVRRGTHEKLPMVHKWRTERMRVESDAPIQYHLDGEYRELPTGQALDITVHPRRIKIIL